MVTDRRGTSAPAGAWDAEGRGARRSLVARESSARRNVESLSCGDLVDDIYVIRRLHLRRTKAGKDYLSFELGDRTGSIQARHWEGGRALHERLQSSPFVLARGVVEEWGHELQVKVRDLGPVAPSEVDPRELIEHPPFDPDAMIADLP